MIESYTSQETINRAAHESARFLYGPFGPFIDRVHPNLPDRIAETDRARRAEERQRRADALRLVKATKSRTRDPESDRRLAKFFADQGVGAPPWPRLIETPRPWAKKTETPGTWAVIERRDWCGEYRIRMETRAANSELPPEQAGDRVTAMLTDRGARKISESCYYMACKRGGFTTFATLTLTPEAREKLARRVVVPAHAMTQSGYLQPPIAPAKAKQGPFAPDYSETDQITRANQQADIAAEYAALHPETGRPFTPLKNGWAWSVQREAGRFFEAANKMYQRGWQYKRLGNRVKERAGLACDIETRQEYQPLETVTVKVKGSRKQVPKKRQDKTPQATIKTEFGKPITVIEDGPYTPIRYAPVTWLEDGPYTPIEFKPEPLAYLWVAEAPDMVEKCWKPEHARPIADENGELLKNPHLHLMMKWRVHRVHFRHWAARLEKLWGQGMAHLEKIKDPQKAGSYVAKAAGYVSKAQGKTDQGEIRGNRYGISSRARAPGWIECERHQVGMMGWLLAEAHEAWNRKHGPKLQERERLKRQLDQAKTPAHRQKIGKILEGVRAKLEPLTKVSKYGAIFKSKEKKDRFITWARKQGWTEKPQCSQWLHQWRREQLRRRNRSRLMAGGNDWADWFALADAGAVECGNDDDYEVVHLPLLQA